jgi:PAS domain S-box-containing protein
VIHFDRYLERKRVMQSNEQNLAAIINTIPTAAWTTRPDGYCDFLNQVWLDYAGMTGEKALGWGWVEAIHSEDRNRLVETWQSCLASGTPVETEARIRRFDSAYRWFLIRGNPLRNELGEVLKWYGTCVDIEDRKRREEDLRAQEFSWRQIVDNIPGLVVTTAAGGEVEFLNRQTLEYFGRTREELKDWALIGAVHPGDLPRVIGERKKSIETGQPYEIEHRCRRADGVYRWFQVRGLPVRGAENKIIAWYLLLADIDDRKRAEEALRERELNLRQITETIPEMLWSSTPEGSIDYCNGRLLEFTGFASAEVVGTNWIKLLHPDDVERAVKAWSHCVKTGDPYRVEVRTFHASDDTYRWCITRALPLVDSEGRIVKWHGTVVDMHDWKVAQEELRSTQAELAKMMRVMTLNVLTASIAHEINQPLASLITNASISLRRLNDDPPNVDGARETVQRTIRDANRASDVVTRLRALFSKKEFTLETFDLNEITREVIALSSNELQDNRVILQLELAADLPLVTGDRVQLQQVTINLLNNASDAMVGIEDRPRHLLVRTQQDGDNQVRLSVRDAGCGVNPKEFDRLFEPFYTTKGSGMGIGLSISRSIIERHRGRLWAEPNDGPGTTFSFSIPCSPDSSTDVPA